MTQPSKTQLSEDKKAWTALWALVIGFFMILVDSTIVSTAMPAIMRGLDTDINGVIWVNSAYLLAFAVPLLITGRLGDRFGPRNIYLVGLFIFTLASLWCGLSPDVTTLIVARVVQGLGAALMSPQTMTFITRMFPVARRGAAMGVWGAVAGIATLVGPIAGGIFVDTLGWEWIFFVNVPVGIIAIWRVLRKVPELERHSHSFDWVGVALSAAAMFLIVFGIQEGNNYSWGPIWGWFGIWHMIGAGVALLILFVLWQGAGRVEPLVPLGLFKDRNFSLANIAIAFMGLSITAMSFPMVLYLQSVRGLTPTLSALMLAPMAVVSGVLAPLIGKNINRVDARKFAIPGFFLFGASITVYGLILGPDTPFWLLLLPPLGMGIGSAMIWPSVSMTATRDLGQADAGAGSGVYNTTRQVGSVLGSALIALMMESRIAAETTLATAGMQGAAPAADAGEMGGAIPVFLHAAVSTALGQALLLPGIVAMVAALVAFAFRKTPVRPPAGL
ncbi:DHA2 family efflux MFS transporter permease subunit [Paeniglutamicibacter cryotolerans]|uniref:EmrB/QacA subfamily drug resistance transporter n=1 Tax=Paeniglutamicibacter cryotolerans TaxID=670079 RepID=A0A839QQR8_9MICC|nr:DHA2 family efflux MFS transporter permease subunit [Paeniglutamicibacter cryotolerans]MBB2994421.1 EmrB/QacA subfamily drug resistance transporter [Paeniglutamicibacter cryotolerans]